MFKNVSRRHFDGWAVGRAVRSGKAVYSCFGGEIRLLQLSPSLPLPGLAGAGRARKGAGEAGGVVHSFVEDRCCSSSAGRALHGDTFSDMEIFLLENTTDIPAAQRRPMQAAAVAGRERVLFNRRNLVMCTFLRSFGAASDRAASHLLRTGCGGPTASARSRARRTRGPAGGRAGGRGTGLFVVSNGWDLLPLPSSLLNTF